MGTLPLVLSPSPCKCLFADVLMSTIPPSDREAKGMQPRMEQRQCRGTLPPTLTPSSCERYLPEPRRSFPFFPFGPHTSAFMVASSGEGKKLSSTAGLDPGQQISTHCNLVSIKCIMVASPLPDRSISLSPSRRLAMPSRLPGDYPASCSSLRPRQDNSC